MTRASDVSNVSLPDPESDAHLLTRLEQKDESAMSALFARHSRLVYSVALRVLRDPQIAEDVVQEVFMQIWNKPVAFVPSRGSLSSLLAVMARNRSIDHIRGKKVTESVDDLHIASSYNLANDAEHRIMLERVRAVIGELPAEQKSALEMAFFGGLTHVEIAEQTGQPLGTIKTRIRAALQRLERTFDV